MFVKSFVSNLESGGRKEYWYYKASNVSLRNFGKFWVWVSDLLRDDSSKPYKFHQLPGTSILVTRLIQSRGFPEWFSLALTAELFVSTFEHRETALFIV